jgi:hypothetical protein
VIKTIAGLAVPNVDQCIRAIYGGTRRQISSECGQAALEVLPFLASCRVARKANRAGNGGKGGAGPREIGPTGNPGAFPFRGKVGLPNKRDARKALSSLDATSEQLALANRAIRRATTSSTIDVGKYGPNVVVRVRRPGRDGYQLIETVIKPNGSMSVVQMGYNSKGKLTHYDVKQP